MVVEEKERGEWRGTEKGKIEKKRRLAFGDVEKRVSVRRDVTLRGKQTRQTRVSRDTCQELGRSQVQLRSCSCWRREERKDLNSSTFAFLYPVIMSAEPKIQYVLQLYESSGLFLSLSGRGVMLTMCLHLEICSTSPRASSRTCLPV